MSEYNPSYRIVTYQSKLQKRIMLAFYAFMILSVFTIPPVYSFIWAIKLIVIALLAYIAFKSYRTPSEVYTFNLKETGKIELQEQQSWPSFNIGRFSLFCDWFCLLRLTSDSPLNVQSDKRNIWIWRDGADEDSYRRVCRVIARVRSGA